MKSTQETPFTARMRQICDEAPGRCDGYHPTRFRQMIGSSEGNFLPVAQQILLSGSIQQGLMTLAKHGALDISMEAVVQQDPWRELFTKEQLGAAEWRLGEARRRLEMDEPADRSD